MQKNIEGIEILVISMLIGVGIALTKLLLIHKDLKSNEDNNSSKKYYFQEGKIVKKI